MTSAHQGRCHGANIPHGSHVRYVYRMRPYLPVLMGCLLLTGCSSGVATTSPSPTPAAPSPSVTSDVSTPIATSSATPSSIVAPAGRPGRAAIAAAVKGLLAQRDPGFKVQKLTHVEVARDSKGRWWVSAFAVPPASAEEETPQVVAVAGSGRWLFAGWGTDIATTLGIRQMHIPKEVVRALFPYGLSDGG
jgi:hypothetical protein